MSASGTWAIPGCPARLRSLGELPGHGSIVDPVLNIDGEERPHQGYITDLLNGHAVEFLRRERTKPFALFFAHKAVHPDAFRAADGTDLSKGGYRPAPRHADLWGEHFPRRPNALPASKVVKDKPGLDGGLPASRQRGLAQGARRHPGGQRRGDPPARRHDGLGRRGHGRGLRCASRRPASSTTPSSLFLGDNGYFFGEHGLGRNAASPTRRASSRRFWCAIPPGSEPGTVNDDLVLALDIAPTLVDLRRRQGGDFEHMQGLSLRPLANGGRAGWRRSFMCEYFSENAMPWLIGMSYKAIRASPQVHPLDAEVARRRRVRRAL